MNASTGRLGTTGRTNGSIAQAIHVCAQLRAQVASQLSAQPLNLAARGIIDRNFANNGQPTSCGQYSALGAIQKLRKVKPFAKNPKCLAQRPTGTARLLLLDAVEVFFSADEESSGADGVGGEVALFEAGFGGLGEGGAGEEDEGEKDDESASAQRLDSTEQRTEEP